MNRVEFMDRLAELLQDIAEEEREEAICFYNDYFEDAGEANEAEVIRELESPKKVADKIRAVLGEAIEDETKELSERSHEERPKTNKWMLFLACLILLSVVSLLKDGGGDELVAIFVVTFIQIAGFIILTLFAGTLIGICGIGSVGAAFLRFYRGLYAMGLGMLGGGLILMALGAMLTVVIWWFYFKQLPKLWTGFREFYRRKFLLG